MENIYTYIDLPRYLSFLISLDCGDTYFLDMCWTHTIEFIWACIRLFILIQPTTPRGGYNLREKKLVVTAFLAFFFKILLGIG